ncbi:hypothetical protein, partial [Rhizobium leucaenae]|uniref:hypothetical protein n=1 Tax=Rhizobium leucaenae TaxID=29450 RepID=UPI001AEF35B4
HNTVPNVEPMPINALASTCGENRAYISEYYKPRPVVIDVEAKIAVLGMPDPALLQIEGRIAVYGVLYGKYFQDRIHIQYQVNDLVCSH